jgi:CrcB protein
VRIALVVGLGGGAGSLARHGVSVIIHRLGWQPVPYATAMVNLLGCVAIGALAGALSAGSIRLTQTGRAFVFVGLLGGFTTFSSLGLDTLTLVRGGSIGTALVNAGGQLVVGLAGALAAYWFAS